MVLLNMKILIVLLLSLASAMCQESNMIILANRTVYVRRAGTHQMCSSVTCNNMPPSSSYNIKCVNSYKDMEGNLKEDVCNMRGENTEDLHEVYDLLNDDGCKLVVRFYAESGEPLLSVHRRLLALGYVNKLRSLPSLPSHAAVFEPPAADTGSKLHARRINNVRIYSKVTGDNVEQVLCTTETRNRVTEEERRILQENCGKNTGMTTYRTCWRPQHCDLANSTVS